MRRLFKAVCSLVVMLPEMLAPLKVHASAGFDNVAQHVVYFDPAIVISGTNEPCSGVLRSLDSIVTSSECANSAWQLINSGTPVMILRSEVSDKTPVGQLPDLSQRHYARLLQRTKSDMLVPYVPALSGADNNATDFPLFLPYKNSGLFSGSAWLLQSAGNSIWQAVVLRQQDTNPVSYWVTPVEGEPLDTTIQGNPVVDGKGETVCLMGKGISCTAFNDPPEFDDGSCKIPYFQCQLIKWTHCLDHMGLGSCTDLASNSTCDVAVYPNHYDTGDDDLHCLNAEGCGGIFCPAGCIGDSGYCSCSALWGWCEMKGKTETIPSQCMAAKGGGGSVNFRCNHSRFLGVVIGVPLAVAAVVVLAIVGGVVYKCRHPKYERMD